MKLSLIAAVAEDNAIGIDNKLPWHLPEDLKFFKRITMGKPVIMGRKTFESLGRVLPGRRNIILTENADYVSPVGTEVFRSVDALVESLEQEQIEESFVIGGGIIFALTMPLADQMYLTRVKTHIPEAHTFFPEIDHTHWKMKWQEPHFRDAQHAYDFTFELYERIEI